MKGQAIKSKLRNILGYEGISLFGVADAAAEDLQKQIFFPKSLLPEAKSVVIFGVAIPRGIVNMHSSDLLQYARFCNMSYRKLDMAANVLCGFLEEEGALASPAYSCFPQKVVNREYYGLLPLVLWAVEAGLGQLSRSGLLVSPRYGTRVLLCGLVTSAEMPPDRRINDIVCPPGCRLCVEICQGRAIGKSGKVDHSQCLKFANPNPLFELLIRDERIKKSHSFESMLNVTGVDDHSLYACAECLRVCRLNNG
jgi:epoxyqueuosine reductase